MFWSFFSGHIQTLDVGFLVDSSNSVNWQKSRKALSIIIDNLDVSQSGTHVGLIPYSSSATVAVPFPTVETQPYNPDVAKNLINSVVPLRGAKSRVDRAFQIANDVLFAPRNASRRASEQV